MIDYKIFKLLMYTILKHRITLYKIMYNFWDLGKWELQHKIIAQGECT